MGERESAHHADERTQTAAHQDEAQQEDQVIRAGEDVLDAELQHRPGHGDPARPGARPVQIPGGVSAVEHLHLRLARAEEARHMAVPGRQRVEHRHGQREPTGNLGADVADLEHHAPLGLERPGAVDRSGADLGIGAHGQALGERTRDGVVARGQLVGADRPVVIGVNRGQQPGQLPAGHPEVAVDRLAVQAVLAAGDADRVGEGAALGREGGEGERGRQEGRGAANPSASSSASGHREATSQCGGNCATGALAAAATYGASVSVPRKATTASISASVIGGGAPSRRL